MTFQPGHLTEAQHAAVHAAMRHQKPVRVPAPKTGPALPSRLDRWVARIGDWISSTGKAYTPLPRATPGVLTVGELTRLLADVPDHVQVLVGTGDWFENITEVCMPNDFDGPYIAVTLFTADTFDTRQF